MKTSSIFTNYLNGKIAKEELEKLDPSQFVDGKIDDYLETIRKYTPRLNGLTICGEFVVPTSIPLYFFLSIKRFKLKFPKFIFFKILEIYMKNK